MSTIALTKDPILSTPADFVSREKAQQDAFKPDDLKALSADLEKKMRSALNRFQKVNSETQILAINATIEAARAGESGRSFSVVAEEMKKVSGHTGQIADTLATDVYQAIKKIEDFSRLLGSQVRGTRLVDLALNNIDLVDRNLYERSCDVRWWATDSSVSSACASMDESRRQYASKRLGIILDAYTVYHDLVLCDLDGKVIANGRPGRYSSQGMDCSREPWFRQAVSSRSGDEFGFQPVHMPDLVNRKAVLAYSCGVRKDGESRGPLVGALGILFNWDALAYGIIEQTSITHEEWKNSRVCFVDGKGGVLADSQHAPVGETLMLDGLSEILAGPNAFQETRMSGKPVLVAHAKAPGYETYTTGWHSLIIQALS